jgi:hypothetical protein
VKLGDGLDGLQKACWRPVGRQDGGLGEGRLEGLK